VCKEFPRGNKRASQTLRAEIERSCADLDLRVGGLRQCGIRASKSSLLSVAEKRENICSHATEKEREANA
jgi:hypothetical protein